MSERIELDIDDLTIGEVEDIEEMLGVPFDELVGDGKPKGKMLRAVAWVFKRREDPTFTFEQARDLRFDLKAGAVPPTGAADFGG